jgi:AcrR family transcriptional regulator
MQEKIVTSAIELIYKKGFAQFSVRNLAKYMGVSTRPLYYYYVNLEKLYESIAHHVLGVLQTYVEKSYTEQTFLNAGIGYVLFAKELPDHYAILMIREFWRGQSFESNDVDNFMKSKASEKEKEMYGIMKTYTLGMALIASAQPELYPLERIISEQTNLMIALATSYDKK